MCKLFMGQGRENSKVFLRDNPDLFTEMRQGVLTERQAKEESAKSNGSNGKGRPTPGVAAKSETSPEKKATAPAKDAAASARRKRA